MGVALNEKFLPRWMCIVHTHTLTHHIVLYYIVLVLYSAATREKSRAERLCCSRLPILHSTKYIPIFHPSLHDDNTIQYCSSSSTVLLCSARRSTVVLSALQYCVARECARVSAAELSWAELQHYFINKKYNIIVTATRPHFTFILFSSLLFAYRLGILFAFPPQTLCSVVYSCTNTVQCLW